MAQLTDLLAQPTDLLTQLIDQLAKLTDLLARRTDLLAELTDLLAKLTDLLAELTDLLAELTDSVAQLTDLLARLTYLLAQLTDLVSHHIDLLSQPTDLLSQPTDLLARRVAQSALEQPPLPPPPSRRARLAQHQTDIEREEAPYHNCLLYSSLKFSVCPDVCLSSCQSTQTSKYVSEVRCSVPSLSPSLPVVSSSYVMISIRSAWVSSMKQVRSGVPETGECERLHQPGTQKSLITADL